MRALAWCGVLAPTLRLGLILLLGSLDPSYSQLRDYISELGARGAPSALVMNVIGTSLVGILLCIFSLGLYQAKEPSVLKTAGTAFLALSGLAFILVGVFPCDPGCSLVDPSASMRIHMMAGTVAMVSQAIAPMLFGLRLVSGTSDRRHAATSLACGAIAVGAVIVLLLGQGASLAYPGLFQKVFQAAADLWVLISAVHLLRNA